MEKEQIEKSLIEIPGLVDAFKLMRDKFAKLFPQKFADVKLKDGTIIRYEGDTPQIGMPVIVVTPEGQEIPAPDGDMTAEDGTVISIKGGMIAAVTPGQAATPEGGEAPVEQNAAPAQSAAPTRVIESKEYVFEAMKEKFDELFNEAFKKKEQEIAEKISPIEAENKELKEKINSMEEFNKELFSVVKQISELPSEKSGVDKKDGFIKIDNREEAVKEFRKKYLND